MFAIPLFPTLSSSDQPDKPKRSLADTYELARVLYDSSTTLDEALELFNAVITNDSSGCFWKSYVFIANIYLKRFEIDSAIAILDYAEKHFSSLPNFYEKGDILGDLRTYRSEVSVNSLLDIYKVRPRRINYEDGVYQKAPEIVGGHETIKRNLKYPQDALKQGIEDTVWIQVHVSWRGDVCHAIVTKGGKLKSLRDEALRVIYETKWTPAVCLNFPADVRISVPVRFTKKNFLEQKRQ
jgi:TonB family protein